MKDALTVPGKPKLAFRPSDRGGWEYTDDGGENWYFTFRTESEIRAMWKVEGNLPPDPEDELRETFGETLDEPLPDDLVAMLTG